MNTKIIGLIYFAVSILIALLFLASVILGFWKGMLQSDDWTQLALVVLFVFIAYWAIKLRNYKKWAWNLGMICIPIISIAVLFGLIGWNHSIDDSFLLACFFCLVIGEVLFVFTIYVLIVERQLFLRDQPYPNS